MNLKTDITLQQFDDIFGTFGEITSSNVKVNTLPKSGDRVAAGFVAYKTAQEAARAKKEAPESAEFKEQLIEGSDIVIEYLRPKAQREREREQYRASKRRMPRGGHMGGFMDPNMYGLSMYPNMFPPMGMMMRPPHQYRGGNRYPTNRPPMGGRQRQGGAPRPHSYGRSLLTARRPETTIQRPKQRVPATRPKNRQKT